MRKICFIFSITLATSTMAQQAETVYPTTQEVREIGWYQQQQELWKAETAKNKTNANAWYNYFSATRALRNLVGNESRTPEESEKLRIQYDALCTTIAADALKEIPNTFEANFIRFWGGNIVDDAPYLMKAYAISPNDPRILGDMMIRYEITGDKAMQEQFAKKMYEHNALPASILNWGYNLLSELDTNAIVFTGGDNDTYALWVVQAVKQYRKDITVINSSLIEIESYRKLLFAKLGLGELPVIENDKRDLIRQTRQHVSIGTGSVYLSLTALRLHLLTEHIIEFEDMYFMSGNVEHMPPSTPVNNEPDSLPTLYLTGLAYKYSQTGFDNMATIRRNYEKRYLLDYLEEQFAFNRSDQMGEWFNATYLPSMIKLYIHYRDSDDSVKQSKIKHLLLEVSKKSGYEKQVLEFIKE